MWLSCFLFCFLPTSKFIAHARLTASETERAPLMLRTDTPLATGLLTLPHQSALTLTQRQQWAERSSSISIPSLTRTLKLPKSPQAVLVSVGPADTPVDLNHQLTQHRKSDCQNVTNTCCYLFGWAQIRGLWDDRFHSN